MIDLSASQQDYSNKYYLGFVLALAAGLIWSFGAPTIRHMIDADIYQWHYLFYRGITVATILVIFLLYKEGIDFYKNFRRVGSSGVIGGVSLAFAFIFFIFGMTFTSAATTLFMIGTQPLFAGLLAYIFLKEQVRSATIIACLISFFGIFLGLIFLLLRSSKIVYSIYYIDFLLFSYYLLFFHLYFKFLTSF